MTTIFTDDFSRLIVDIDLNEKQFNHVGRDIVFTAKRRDIEMRITLTDAQFEDLFNLLLLNGYGESMIKKQKDSS